jgi:hypothetical protein
LKQLKKDQDELADVLLGTVLSEEGRIRAEKLKNDILMDALINDMNKSVITKSSTSRGGKRKPKSQIPSTFEFKGINPATFTLPSSGASVTASGGGPDVLSESMGGMNLRMPRRRSKSRRKVSRKKSRRRSKSRRKVSRKKSRRRSKSRRKVSRKKSRRKSKSRRKVSKKKFQKKSRVGCWGCSPNDSTNRGPPPDAPKVAKMRSKLKKYHKCLDKQYRNKTITCRELNDLNEISRKLSLPPRRNINCDENNANSTCFF